MDIMVREPGVLLFLQKDIYSAVRTIYCRNFLMETPLLFLQGESDKVIQLQDSIDLLARVNKRKRMLFPGTKHVGTFKTNSELYPQTVSDFSVKA